MECSLEELAQKIGAKVEGDGSKKISGLSDLQHAGEHEVSFFANPRYYHQMVESGAGAVIVAPEVERPSGRSYLLHERPSEAFQKLISLFKGQKRAYTGFSGVHPTAVIHPTATIGSHVTICPYVVIDEGSCIGDESFIGSFSYVGPYVQIGSHVHIHPSVVIRERCELGDRVIVQPGAVIGSCGYGYATDAAGHHTKLEQLGNVVLHEEVEIGANTTIDRARFQSTVVGQGTKIDNQVQIAHNVQIGKRSLIVAHVGIAGSTKVGNNVVMGGKVAVNGHIEICDATQFAACSGISKSIVKPGAYGGVPVLPLAESNRRDVLLRRIEKLYDRVEALEQQSNNQISSTARES